MNEVFRFTKLKIADQTVGPECNKSWLVFMNEIGGGLLVCSCIYQVHIV